MFRNNSEVIVMNTTDWQFDFSSLPYWDNRNSLDCEDAFYALPKTDTLCCIYSIAEVPMGDCKGFLAILRGKNDPILLTNPTYKMNFSKNFSASTDESLIFLQPCLYCERHGRVRPILVIDLKKNRFAYIRTKNTNPCYKIIPLSDHVFTVEAYSSQRNDKRLMSLHGRKIRTKWLRWHDLSKLNNLHDMLF